MATDHLAGLRTLVRRPVSLGRRQQPEVVGLFPKLHELIDELLRGQAAEPPVLRRHDHVEAPRGLGDEPLLL